MDLFTIIKNFRKGIFVALFLVVIEDVAWIVEPTVFGKVIDAVIDVQYEKTEMEGLQHSIDSLKHHSSEEKDSSDIQALEDSLHNLHTQFHNSYLGPLLLWVAVFIINSGTGSLRRSYDPRVFLKIYAKIAMTVSDISLRKQLSTSIAATRAELAYQYISFFQYRVPEIIENIIYISGAIFALYFFDWLIALVCLLIIVPLYIANGIYQNKVFRLQREFHDNYENIFNVFDKKDPEYVYNYYTQLAEPQKKIADWGAINFTILRITLLAIFVVVLFISIDLDNFSAGELYSIVAYLWTFVTATENFPELMENWTSLRDISRRIKLDKY
ncbi:MAG: ABC transporter six-transmembrane domain-containing protein [Ignavibacteria bacterium]